MKVRILLVDDSPMVRRAMRSLIERNPKLEVCGEAENGQIAVEMFQQLKPDLVVLDFSMPIKNGLQAAQEISTLHPGIPLLMVTMFRSDQLTKEAQKAGIGSVLSKGDNLSSNLVSTIESLASK
ncbi:MAG: response regulator transcription factor [Acidobacteriota bacterium]|nr:response regulator transcription factor [Acidobacteriota bacterium]